MQQQSKAAKLAQMNIQKRKCLPLLTTVADAWIHQTFAFDSFNNLGQHPL